MERNHRVQQGIYAHEKVVAVAAASVGGDCSGGGALLSNAHGGSPFNRQRESFYY